MKNASVMAEGSLAADAELRGSPLLISKWRAMQWKKKGRNRKVVVHACSVCGTLNKETDYPFSLAGDNLLSKMHKEIMVVKAHASI